MASVHDNTENAVVNYLRDPSFTSKRVEKALQQYIEQLDDNARRRILPGWRKPVKRSRLRDTPYTQSVGNSGDIKGDLLAYLNLKQRERALHDENLKSTVSCDLALGAFTAILSGLTWHKTNKIEDLWAKGESDIITSERFKCSSPLERLAILYDSSVSDAFWNEFKRRILALLIQHDHKQPHKSASIGATGRVQGLEKLFRKVPANANAVSKCANSWIRWIEVWGFGGLVLPGPGHQGAFENGLSSENFKDLRDFCDQRLPDIPATVRQTHEIVRCLLVRAIEICGGDKNTLRNGQGSLTNAYRTHFGTHDDGTPATLSIITTPDTDPTPPIPVGEGRTPLETLAEVAGSRLSDGAGLVSPSGVTRVLNDGTTTNAPIQTPGPNQGSASDAGVFSDGMATQHVLAPGPPEPVPVPTALYGQAVRPPWQSHLQQRLPHYSPPHSAQIPQQYGCGLASTVTGEQSLPSQWWSAVHGDLSSTSGLNGIHQDTIPKDWNQMVAGAYSQFASRTSYTR